MLHVYIDAEKPDDSGDGLSKETAKKHIYAALALISKPVTKKTVIKIAGTKSGLDEDNNNFR